MPAASAIRIEQILLVTLQDETSAAEIGDLLGMVGDQVVAASARGVLVDVSGLSLVDSYVTRMLANLVAMARMLGAHAMLAGMRPEVAIAMVELGAKLPQIAAAMTVDAGLETLRHRIGSPG